MQTAWQWAESNFGRARLGDVRRTRRFVSMMGAAASRPDGRVSAVFLRAADRQAAYDLLEHEAVTPHAVSTAIGEAAARQCARHQRALIVLDGSSLTVTDRQRSKGFGSIGTRRNGARGIKVMNTLALSPEGEVLGVVAQRYWARGERVKQRGYRRVHERESAHWRHAVDEVAVRCLQHAPGTRLHFVADREADASLLMRHLLRDGHEFTIRANGTRLVRFGNREVALRPWLAQQPPLARMRLQLAATPTRAKRDVTLQIRAARVPMRLRDRHTGHTVVAELTAVWAREQGPVPRGCKRVEWLLYSTDLVTSAAQACAVVQRYALRWRIESMHRVWKSGGCNVEAMQLRSVSSAVKWACMLAAVAARIERLKTLSRTTPDEPATVELTEHEIRALILLKRDQKKRTEVVPDTIPSIAQAVRWIADLGGYVGNKSSGPPGSVVIGRGLQDLMVAARVLEAVETQKR
jgi:Transposase DNA-binding/Transposase Tn5 dimerisation domain